MNIPMETRRESYHTVKMTLTERQTNVPDILKECGNMTAQEVASELHRRGITPTDEPGFAAPRLTELTKAGLIKAVGKKICGKTGRKVAVWSALNRLEASI